jgi:hypothetical protein
VKKNLIRNEAWVFSELKAVVSAAAVSNKVASLEDVAAPFTDFKAALNARYKEVEQLQQYQLFRMTADKPGVVECRRRPCSKPVLQALLKKKAPDCSTTWAAFKPTAAVSPKDEKICDIYRNIYPILASKYHASKLYAVPTEANRAKCTKIKKDRKEARPAPAINDEVMVDDRMIVFEI